MNATYSFPLSLSRSVSGPTLLFLSPPPFSGVWVFEPQPQAFAELVRNFEANPALNDHAHLSNMCVDPAGGRQLLHGSADSEARLATVQGGVKHSSGVLHSSLPATEVTCITWEQLLAEHDVDTSPQRPVVVNVDTEG